jgi:hypothetical protein
MKKQRKKITNIEGKMMRRKHRYMSHCLLHKGLNLLQMFVLLSDFTWTSWRYCNLNSTEYHKGHTLSGTLYQHRLGIKCCLHNTVTVIATYSYFQLFYVPTSSISVWTITYKHDSQPMFDRYCDLHEWHSTSRKLLQLGPTKCLRISGNSKEGRGS